MLISDVDIFTHLQHYKYLYKEIYFTGIRFSISLSYINIPIATFLAKNQGLSIKQMYALKRIFLYYQGQKNVF